MYDETFWILGMEHMTFGHTVPSQAASVKWVLEEECAGLGWDAG